MNQVSIVKNKLAELGIIYKEKKCNITVQFFIADNENDQVKRNEFVDYCEANGIGFEAYGKKIDMGRNRANFMTKRLGTVIQAGMYY